MKKIFLSALCFLSLCFAGNAQEWVGAKSSTPSEVEKSLVSSSDKEIIIDVKNHGFYFETVKTPKGEQMVISADGMADMLIKGAPALPAFPISMIIGDNAEMSVSILESDYIDYPNIEIAPSKGNLSRQVNPADVPYSYGEMYEQDAFYPAQQASLEAPYILRDFRGQNVMVYPYAYNPVTKTLRVYTDLRIAVRKVSDNGVNAKVSNRKGTIKIDPELDMSYERRFINYRQGAAKYEFLVDEGEMLIVCVDAYTEALQELVDWKNISGRPTTMVTTTQTGIQNSLKTYLQNYYNENPNFRYLLLVGENDNLPGNSMSGGKSDNYYGMLEGNDYYEEVLVGRLPVKSLEDAQHQVSKIIHYERDIDETATWLTRAVGIGADEGAGHYGEIDYQHMNFIRDTLMHYGYTEVSQHYAYVNNPTSTTMKNDFNQGAGVANYCNHGSPTSWAVGSFSSTHVHQLTNDNMLPFIWSVACNNGEFSYDECFGEAWMRAKNNTTGAPTGAVGGMFSWISQPWVPPMYGQDEMVAILTEWRPNYKHTLGGASLNGNMFVLDMSPEDNGSTHNTWLLFGDPSMMLRTAAPSKMNVAVTPQTLMVGMTTLTVNAQTEFGIATLSGENGIIASAYVENGVAQLQFPSVSEIETLKLVVMGYNRVTEMMDIEVVPAEGAYVMVNTYDINQEDGQLDYNDGVITLSLNMANIGVETASNVNVTISSESPYVEIIDATESISNLDAEANIDLNQAFKFRIFPSVPNKTSVKFDVVCDNGTDTWESSFDIQAYAPVFKVEGYELEADDSALMPGGSAVLKATVINNGNSKATDLIPEFFSSSTDIVLSEPAISVNELSVGEEVVMQVNVQVAAGVTDGSEYDIVCQLSSDYTVVSDTYKLQIGSISENFETADFSKFDWAFAGNADWTIVSNGAYEGTYCAKSGTIGHNQTSSLKLELEVLTSGVISFYAKTSTEQTYDRLVFYLDNNDLELISGEQDWKCYEYELTEGNHVLEWQYYKDFSESNGQDCVWLDMISFPPSHVVVSLAAVENLEAELQDNNVTLSWDAMSGADEYIVRRDGEIVATQTETSFTESLQEGGIYTYNVVARNGDTYSAPAFVVVDCSDGTAVMEVENSNIAVYPNPTSGILYVDIDTPFDAVVYNYQGQMVKKLSVNNSQIDMTSLAKGAYIVEIRTDEKVFIQKVLVK